MKNTIKETCSCGATLEFTEEIGHYTYSSIEEKQKAFQEAHQPCRQKDKITGAQKITPKKD